LFVYARTDALIVSIGDIADVQNFVKSHHEKQTLVVLNIDPLVLDVIDTFDCANSSQKTGFDCFSPEVAKGVLCSAQIALFSVNELVADLQNRGVIVLGVTSAPPLAEGDILYQLAVGARACSPETSFVHSISFAENRNRQIRKDFTRKNLYSVRDGIIFSGDFDTAKILRDLILRADLDTTTIIFVDTEQQWLEILERDLGSVGYKFIGLLVS